MPRVISHMKELGTEGYHVGGQDLGCRAQLEVLGRESLPSGERISLADGCTVLGQEGHASVVTPGLPVSSVPVLLHSCLRCLHRFPLHPYRLVLVPHDAQVFRGR